ncbi:MAG: efflux RND transporter permease subunit [Vulcanimicrobiaceae bacterium]
MKKFGIPAWAIANPFAVVAIYAAIVLAAIGAALYVLPIRMMPYVESPLIAVVTMAPGLAPEEVETYFSKPIEERMTDLKSVRFVRSIAQRDLSIVTLQFPYGTDMRRALVDVQQLAKQAEADLPYDRANLKPSYILPVDPLNTPVLQVNATGDGWDPVRLREFVANDVVRELKTIPDVQQVVGFGGLQRQLQVIADRSSLASRGLSLLDIRDALDRQNLSRSAGTLTGGGRESIVRGDERVRDPSDVARYPLKADGTSVVAVGDVARVVDGAAERRAAYRFDGRDGVEVSIIENPEASSPRVIAAVDAKLAEIERDRPGLHFTRAYDNARFVGQLTTNMIEELIVSVLLAGLVLLVFLEDVSATLIVMTSIPTCLGLAVLLFVPMGFSINSSTLVGLLLAIGRLVDDSIVVIHSVHHRIEQGEAPIQAAIDGTRDVILPIAAATGVMVLAVVPLVTSGGITQIMFVGLVWPIVFALIASLAVSVTLTPLLAAALFAPHTGSTGWRATFDARVSRALSPARRVLAALDRRYRASLSWALDHRWVTIGGSAIAIYAAVALLPLIGSEMMPLADTGQGFAQLEFDAGTSFAATDAKAKAFERIALAQPEVERVSAEVGEAAANGNITGSAMNGVNSASYVITFSPKEDRKRTIWQVMDAIDARARERIPGIRRLALKEMGADVMATSGAPVEILVYGPDLVTLHRIAAKVAEIARAVPGMVDVATSSAFAQPEQRIVTDRDRAAQLGLAPADVQQQAYYATHGGLTSEYLNPSNLRHDQILVRYDGSDRANGRDLGRVQIVGKNGQIVPLSALASIANASGPTLIEHEGLRRSVSILGYYRKGASSGEMSLDMQTVMGALARVPFPQGYGIAMRGDMTEMMQSFDRLLNAMKIAAFFIFLLLVIQFKSVVQPLVMLLAIPLQLLGVALALILAHQNFSTVSILGIVVANGMAVSNAILLLDLIIAERKRGLDVRAAILAAGPVRLRPILMTTIVSLVVLVPVAFFPKTGIDAYAPLATVIIGGLTVSTILTLFVVPVLHDAFADLGAYVAGRRRAAKIAPAEARPA